MIQNASSQLTSCVWCTLPLRKDENYRIFYVGIISPPSYFPSLKKTGKTLLLLHVIFEYKKEKWAIMRRNILSEDISLLIGLTSIETHTS